VTASGLESSAQTNKTYVTDFGAVTFNRGTAIVAVWPVAVTAAPPTVSSVAPSSGPTAGGTAVTITGTDFVSGATVTLGGTAATGVTVVNDTTITATTAAHAVGAVDVVVTNPDTQSGTLTNGRPPTGQREPTGWGMPYPAWQKPLSLVTSAARTRLLMLRSP
jgi:hypothetical protein